MSSLLATLIPGLGLTRGALIILQNHAVKRITPYGFPPGIPFTPADLATLLALPFAPDQINLAPGPALSAFISTHQLSLVLPLGKSPDHIGYLLLGLAGRLDREFLDQFRAYATITLKSAASVREIKEFNQTLEGKVAERTRELHDAQDKAIKLKDEFVFIATHDLAAPVTAINGFIELINASSDSIPPAIQQKIALVAAASERLKVLVNDLLQVARSDSGTIKVQVTPLDAAPLLQNAVRLAEPSAHRQQVTLTLHLGLDNRLSADANKLNEIFENLLSNAIKYNRPGGTVTVTTLRDPNHYNILIADTGIGIPTAEHAKVFRKFFRSETTEARRQPGTGLGLFVVRMLTEKMGGKISFTSTPGTGSTFILQFPAAN